MMGLPGGQRGHRPGTQGSHCPRGKRSINNLSGRPQKRSSARELFNQLSGTDSHEGWWFNIEEIHPKLGSNPDTATHSRLHS